MPSWIGAGSRVRGVGWATILVAPLLLAGQTPVRLAPGEMTLTARPFHPMILFHAETAEVQVPVVVRNAQGHAVDGLSEGDFTVLDNGHPRQLTGFAIETHPAEASPPASPGLTAPAAKAAHAPAAARPRSVAFLFDDVDTLPAQQNDLARARNAVLDYLRGQGARLPRGEEDAIFTTSGLVRQRFTADRGRLLGALQSIRAQSHAASVGCPMLSPYQAYEIANHGDPDALNLALEQALHAGCACAGLAPSRCTPMLRVQAEEFDSICEDQSQQALDALEAAVAALGARHGDRVLLITSFGFPSQHLQTRISRSIDRAARAGVVINALDARGLAAPEAHASPDDPPVPDANLNSWRDATASDARSLLTDGLAQLADGTGGHFFENNNDFGRAVRQLAAPPSVVYLLSFSPAGDVPDGSLHRLQVKIAAPGRHYRIEARRGYLSPPKPDTVLHLQQRLNQEALAGNEVNQIPAHVGLQEFATATSQRRLHVVIAVAPRGLPFVRSGGRNLEQLSFVAVLDNDQGRYVSGEQGEMNLRLSNASRNALDRSGQPLSAGLTLFASPGHYRLRVLVEESVKGRLFAATTGFTLH
jgi:VWFA-related protein